MALNDYRLGRSGPEVLLCCAVVVRKTRSKTRKTCRDYAFIYVQLRMVEELVK